MALFVAFSIIVAILCVVLTALRKNAYILSYIKWPGRMKRDNKQTAEQFTASRVLNLLKTNMLFPVCPAQGWLLSSLHHGHRVWSTVIPTGSSAHTLTLYSAYAKAHASSQVILQLLKDVSKTGEWFPRVISCTQICPIVEDDPRKPYPSLPVQHDQVKEVMRTDDSLLEGRREFVFKRIWHREDNGCCWMLKMCELSQSWVFFLAQPAEEVENSLLTVISPDKTPGGDVTMDVASLLGCLNDHLSYRKAQFTPLLSITVPPSNKLENAVSSSSDEEPVPNNNNISKGENPVPVLENNPKKDANKSDELTQENTSNKKEVSKGEKHNRTQNDIKAATVSILRPEGRQQSKSSPSSYIVKFGKTEETAVSSGEEYQCSMSCAHLPTVSPGSRDETGADFAIRRVESDSSLFMKPRSATIATAANRTTDANSQKSSDDKEMRKHLILANQGASELLIQSFKASSVDVDQNDKVAKTWDKCPGGWMFVGLDNDVVVLKRLFKNGMSTQSYMGKGIIQASPKTVFDAIRNPRMKFTYDESLKKVDILEQISDTIKIVYFYHEIVQLFRKDSCDFCVLQSERVDGKKYVLSLQSLEWKTAPKKHGTLRGKLLPSGWIVEPYHQNKKVFSMVTFLMQMDMGPGKGSTLPFEDVASRQPTAIVQLREYFKPLTKLVEQSQPD